MTITFTRRQVALALRIVMQAEPSSRLAEVTHTAAADLRLIARNQLAPTAGVLAFFDFEPRGGKFTWKLR